ncbi:MAG TPA: arylsulfotransferase family protein [Gaiellaceae bacterium]
MIRSAVAGAGVLLTGPARLLDNAVAAVAPLEVHHWTSRPDLHPPIVTRLHHTAEASGDHIFLAPLSGPGQRGSLITDAAGEPVWFRHTSPGVALNFRAALYHGKPVLTWWEGATEAGLGVGTHVIMDDTYREIARVPAGGGHPSDLHEFLITSRNTALVTSWERVPMDLRQYGGRSNGFVVGGIVQELELPSGKVLFEWHSLDHVTLDESHAGPAPTGVWDYFHVNSIELDRDGNLLVSARNTWCIYKIDRSNGNVVWRLGGKKSDFEMGPGTVFAWQHDARYHGEGDQLVSLFDDGAAPAVQPWSKGLVLSLDHKQKRVTVHRSFVHKPTLLSHALGSMQLLPNGNWLVGWGTTPYFTEYKRDGDVVFDATLPHGGQNYRALKFPWVGRPADPPTVVAKRGYAYVSWNGATEVAAWKPEAGRIAGSLAAAATERRSGFETTIRMPLGTRYVRVSAVDRHGKALGVSKITRVV